MPESAPRPICLREIVDEVDEEYRREVGDKLVLEALDNASTRVLSNDRDKKTNRVICPVDGCAARCTVYEHNGGYFEAESLMYRSEPVDEEDCIKLNPRSDG